MSSREARVTQKVPGQPGILKVGDPISIITMIINSNNIIENVLKPKKKGS